MRYLVTVLCALTLLVALPQRVAAQTDHEGPTSAALVVHAKRPLPPQLMLRASYYYYVDPVCPSGVRYGKCAKTHAAQTPAEQSHKPAEQSHKKKSLSRGAKAGIAVGVIVGATLIGVGIGVAVWSANFEL